MGWGWLCGHWDGVRELCHWQSMNGCSALSANLWVRFVLHVSGARVGSTEDEETERIPNLDGRLPLEKRVFWTAIYTALQHGVCFA